MTPSTARPRSVLRGLHKIIGRSWRQVVERVFAPPWRVEATVSEMDEVPPRIRSRRAILVATPTRRKWLVFDCPCGAGHRILLNLDRTRRPFWTLRLLANRQFTLHPSIDYQDDSRSCHYFLSRGRVEWAPAPLKQVPSGTRPQNV